MTTIETEPAPDDTATLGQARAWLTEHRDERVSVHCPCCETLHRVYHRALYNAQVRCLIRAADLVRRGEVDEEGFIDWPTQVEPRGGDGVKLHHWGFIERPTMSRDPGAPYVGRYRLTAHGREFVRGAIRVPHAVYLAAENTFLGFCEEKSHPEVDIADVLGVPFNFHDLTVTPLAEVFARIDADQAAAKAARRAASKRKSPKGGA